MMATHPQEPSKAQQTLDWEVSTRPPRRSLLDRLLPSSNAAAGQKTILPVRNNASARAAHAAPSKQANGVAEDGATAQIAQSTSAGRSSHFKASVQTHFDRLLPPHKRYLGRTRRVFLLYIVLPVILLLVLALGLGLGLGLRHHSASKNLPLPGSGVQTGDLTYYTPAQGACGYTNDENDMVVAIAHKLFDAAGNGDANPNNNPLCGRKIRVERDFVETNAGRRSVDVTVVDRCTGCEPTDLDLSPAVFKKLALESEGRVQGSWAWL